MSDWEKNEEIQLFREYLQIPTVHPNVNYGDFLLLFCYKKLTAAKLLIANYRFFYCTKFIFIIFDAKIDNETNS